MTPENDHKLMLTYLIDRPEETKIVQSLKQKLKKKVWLIPDRCGNIGQRVNMVKVEGRTVSDSASSCRHSCLGCVKQNLLVTLTLVGVGIGFIVGFLLQQNGLSANGLMWLGNFQMLINVKYSWRWHSNGTVINISPLALKPVFHAFKGKYIK